MSKNKLKFLSFLLSLIMVLTVVAEIPLSVSAAPVQGSISENAILPETVTTDILPETTVSGDDVTPENTVQFLDSDSTTVLLTVTLQESSKLSSYLASADIIKFVRNGYSISRWYSPAQDRNFKPDYVYSTLNLKKNPVLIAVWETAPYEFSISYQLDGGSFSGDDEVPYSFTVKSDAITLPIPQRAGYLFNGWYSDAAFTTPVSSIPAGTYIDSDANGNVSDFSVYAKWTPCENGSVTGLTAKAAGKGKIKVSFTTTGNAGGYELTYATSKNFKKNKMTRDLGTSTSYTLTNLPKGKTYYFKVRAYTEDSTGKKFYSKFSAIKSCKVKNGVKEFAAKKNSGKLKKVVIQNTSELYVQANVSKRLKSSDDFYYLVKVDPNTNKVLKQIAKTDKTKKVIFKLPLKDGNGTNHIQGKFGVAIKKGKKYMLISSTSFISNPEAAASYTAPFPTPTSKKGRQGLYSLAHGDKNYFANFNLNTIIGSASNYDVAYKYNGNTYYFIKPNFSSISGINEDGGTVTLQVMLQYAENSKDLILKSGRTPGAHYYAFETDNKAAREKIEAAFCFLAEQASSENCHIDNWIIGNEVNTYANMSAKWYYAGNISREKFMKNYASTFRMLYYAVKSNNKNGRVYICCDHTWINRENDWGTRYFTDAFNKEIKKQNKNIQWNLAYHAYSAVLTNADFWNDGSLAPSSLGADFVSPKNLDILTNYIKKNFGKDVRIILSEQGFSCSGGVGSPYNAGRQTGQDVQAAAVAYLYYKAQFNDMIDAVIFSSGDHGGAGYQFDFHGRKAENVYKYMDTPKYESYANPYLPTIGASSWESIVTNFDSAKLKAMPTR